jgi:hypothetical protein
MSMSMPTVMSKTLMMPETTATPGSNATLDSSRAPRSCSSSLAPLSDEEKQQRRLTKHLGLLGRPWCFIVPISVMVSALVVIASHRSSAESRPSETEPPRLPELPILFSVAQIEGAPAVDEAWLEEQLLWANLIYWPAGVSFRAAGNRALAQGHAKLETRQDRHDLTHHVVAGSVNCFVVHSLRDVDDPSRYRQGVHWRPPGFGGKHFVVLSSIAGPTVLAHELGHFFGNHRHSDVRGNIMSYSRGDDPPVFDARQINTVHRHVHRFIGSGELVPTE